MDKKQAELIIKALKAYGKSINKSKAAAQKALQKEGIYTKRGKLSSNYRSKKAA